MRASSVSAPTLVAVNRKLPVVFTVAPYTGAAGSFSTGMLSPVSIDSSIHERPSSTSPSTGSFSPGRTSTTSPSTTSSTWTSIVSPPRTTRAVAGRSAISARIASDALCLALAST